MYLSDFQNLRPPYVVDQSTALDWLAEAHARHAPEVGTDRFRKLLGRYGCSPDKIDTRASFLRDFAHRDWAAMQIFGKDANLTDRTRFFQEALLQPIEKLYAGRVPDFQTWIHVTCTGYVSPSPVQRIASQNAWSVETMHAYHMGCYAAFPAIKMARGNGETEILHTELCTLHLDPKNHEPEQLVIQSLFADGVIRYRAGEKRPSSGYEIVDLKEMIAPGTLDQMEWEALAPGFRMTLGREVPAHVERGVRELVKPWRSPDAVYAIHPGGPRIIDAVKDALELSEEQVHFSRQVLREFGNMSSATLPHVWMKMLTEIPEGAPVISMAFGPGLTLSGGLMRKCS